MNFMRRFYRLRCVAKILLEVRPSYIADIRAKYCIFRANGIYYNHQQKRR